MSVDICLFLWILFLASYLPADGSHLQYEEKEKTTKRHQLQPLGHQLDWEPLDQGAAEDTDIIVQ
jgi:hypothetical protein